MASKSNAKSREDTSKQYRIEKGDINTVTENVLKHVNEMNTAYRYASKFLKLGKRYLCMKI